MATEKSTSVASGASGQRNLKVGMQGEDVREWQRLLIRDGHDLSPFLDDGEFGVITQSATMAWQAARGLAASGIVDATTRAAIGTARTKRPSFGVDSLRPVGSKSGSNTLAQLAVNDLGGQSPLFWGRYVSKPGGSDYRPVDEAETLKSLGIRVLPIARQTGHVGGTAALGKTDAKNNILALKEVFGSDVLKAREDTLYLFLDVEAGTPLSREYYTAWAEEITNADVMVGPCLYMPNFANHPASWKALQGAISGGAECDGLWIAWYLRDSGSPFVVPPSWDVRKMANPTQVPVLAWQYLGDVHDHALDYSVVNPAIDLDEDLLAHLILPA